MAITPKPDGNVLEYDLNTSNKTYTKTSGYWKSFSLINTSGGDVTITVNSMAILVKDAEVFGDNFVDFNSLAVATTGQYRIVIRG